MLKACYSPRYYAQTHTNSMEKLTAVADVLRAQQMVELIRQNFNHPSILFWGIQNEIQISGERPELRKLVN